MAKQRNVREQKGKTRPRGRPPSHQETWSKVSVVLFDRQIVHLDRLATDIRGKSGKVLNRAGLIRALIDALIDSGLDITTSASETAGKRPACIISLLNSTPFRRSVRAPSRCIPERG
jgi:hypothetical protein